MMTKQITAAQVLRLPLKTFLARAEAAVEPKDREVFEHAAAMLLKQIGATPVKAQQPVKSPRDGHKAAIRAHRSRVAAKLPGSCGKVRVELKAKIAHYDTLLAA